MREAARRRCSLSSRWRWPLARWLPTPPAGRRREGAASTTLRVALIEQGRRRATRAKPDGTTAAALGGAPRRRAIWCSALIKAGADVKRANDYGATPMSEAAITGDADVIEALLEGRRRRRSRRTPKARPR